MDDLMIKGILDKQNDSLNEFIKSSAAATQAAVDGVASLQLQVVEQQKAMQEMAAVATAMSARPKDVDEVTRAFGESMVKAASEGTNSAGGYTVQDEQSKMIRSMQDKYGLVRQIFGSGIVPMESDVLQVPVDTYEVSGVSGTGNVPTPASTSENSAITESADAELSQVTLTTAKYATLNYLSKELLADSFVDFIGAYLTPKMARQMSRIEDGVVFTAATTGLFNNTNMQRLVMDSGSSAFTNLTYENIIDMEDEVVDDALDDGGYIAHRSIVNLLKKIKGTDGHPLWMPAAGPEPASVNGYGIRKGSILPRKSNDAVSTGFLAFGDVAKACVVGERMGREIAMSEHFRFNYYQVAIRMVERFAYNTNANLGKALTVLVTAAE